MKIPQKAIHLVIGLEGVLLIAVLVFAVLNPIKNAVVKSGDLTKNEPNIENTSAVTEQETEQNTEQGAEENDPVQTVIFSEAVQTKVLSMSLEEKVAQMFVTTPEQLTDMRQVTATGDTSKNAIRNIPVGGLVYSALNFEGSVQTASMTLALQEYYTQQFGLPLFTMVEEAGGAEGSPLATANGFAVELSPEEIATANDAAAASAKAGNIAAYLKNQGLNTNMGIYGDVDTETTMDATIRAYKEAGITTVLAMGEVYQEKSTVYDAAIAAGTDVIMVKNSISSDMVHYLRADMGYQGVLMTDSLATETLQQNGSVPDTAVAAINAGMDMVYCPGDFKAAYQAVLDAVADGTINEELINEAVMRILTCKEYE